MTVDEMVKLVLGDRPVAKRLSIPSAARLVKSAGANWAVFPVGGRELSVTDIRGIDRAHELGVRPILVTSSHEGIKAIRDYFVSKQVFVLCIIAGEPRIISPIQVGKRRRMVGAPPIVRVN